MKAGMIAVAVFIVAFVSIFLLISIIFGYIVKSGIHSDWWYPWAGIVAFLVAIGYSFRIYKVVK